MKNADVGSGASVRFCILNPAFCIDADTFFHRPVSPMHEVNQTMRHAQPRMRTIPRRPTCVLAAVVCGILAVPAVLAHHSFAMYDQSRTVTLTGKLTRFIPGSNHAQLIFELLDSDGRPIAENGKPLVWGVETGSAAAMARQGVTVQSMPIGTILTVSLYPLRDGRTFGAIAGLLITCGGSMPEGGCTKESGQVLIGG